MSIVKIIESLEKEQSKNSSAEKTEEIDKWIFVIKSNHNLPETLRKLKTIKEGCMAEEDELRWSARDGEEKYLEESSKLLKRAYVLSSIIHILEEDS